MKDELVKETPTSFRVKTNGYSEQFTSIDKANKVYEKIKTRKIRNEETFSIKIEQRIKNAWSVVAEAKINEDYYENEDDND